MFSGHRTGQFQGNADRRAAIWGKQNTVQTFWGIGSQFLRKLNGFFIGISSGGKREFLKLTHERTHHFGVGKPYLVHIVAVKIQVTLP